jgi:hypothetical protein
MPLHFHATNPPEEWTLHPGGETDAVPGITYRHWLIGHIAANIAFTYDTHRADAVAEHAIAIADAIIVALADEQARAREEYEAEGEG